MKKTAILLGLPFLFAGCQTRTINEIRVVGQFGLGIAGASVCVDTTNSGYPPNSSPAFISDANGRITFPNPIQLNNGSYVMVSTDSSTRVFTSKELLVNRREILVLHLDEPSPVDAQGGLDFNAQINAPNVRINEE